MNWEKLFFDFDMEYSEYCGYIASHEWAQAAMSHGYLMGYLQVLTAVYDSIEKDENILNEIVKRSNCIYEKYQNED